MKRKALIEFAEEVKEIKPFVEI